MTTPATATQTRKPRTELSATVEEFKTKTDELEEKMRNLNELYMKLGANGENPVTVNGQRIGKKELRSLQSQLGKELQLLPKYFGTASKAKGKRKRVVKPGDEKKQSKAGFSNPMFVSSKLREFFAKANLGPVDPSRPVGPDNHELIKYLPLLTERGITNSALLTPLFSIYVNRNALQENAQRNKNRPPQDRNNQYLGCNPDMDRVFGQTPCSHAKTGGLSEFAFLEDQDKKKPRSDKNGVLIAPFSRSDFRFASFQSVVALNRVSLKDELLAIEEKSKTASPAERAQLEARRGELTVRQSELDNAEVKARLEQEFKIVQQVNTWYKAKNEPAQKQMRADRRRQQKASTAPSAVPAR